MSSGVNAKVLFEYIADQDDELTIRMGDIITNVQQEDGGWWKGEVNGKSGMFPENFVSIVKTQPPSTKPVAQTTFKAEVKFDYDPVQDDEIALVKGTIIEVTDTPDEGWWKGRYNGKEGLFPSNFVVTSETSKSSEATSKPLPFPTENTKQPEPEAISSTKSSHPPRGPSKIANLLGMIKPEDLLRKNLKKVAVNGAADQKTDEMASEADNVCDAAMKPTQLVPPMHVDGEKEKKKKVPMMPTVPAITTKEMKPLQYAVALYDYEPELADELKLKIGDKITVIDSELTFDGWMKGEVNGNVGIFPDNFVELVDNPGKHSAEPTREEPVQKPVVSPMLPPGAKPLQDELAKKLAQKPTLNSSPPLKASKAPPPPIPGGKPSLLPGTKPKPQVPHSKPLKPPFHTSRSDKQVIPPDTKPVLPKDETKPGLKPEPKLPTNKPVLPRNDVRGSIDNTDNVQMLPKTDPKMNILKPVRSPSLDELKSETQHMKDSMDPALPKCASTSSAKKPSLESQIQRSRTVSGAEAESLLNRSSVSDSKKEIIKDESDATEEGHKKLTGKPSLQLDAVKPTDPLKHIQRVKQPSKSPPSKYKDKHPFEETVESDDDNTKEVNELKSQVADLQDKMLDMEERFKKLVIQLTDDLSNERKLRSNQQIDIDSLNRKLDIFLHKPLS